MSAHKDASHITAFHRKQLNHRPWLKHFMCVCVCVRALHTWLYSQAQGRLSPWIHILTRALQKSTGVGVWGSLLSVSGFIRGTRIAALIKVACKSNPVCWNKCSLEAHCYALCQTQLKGGHSQPIITSHGSGTSGLWRQNIKDLRSSWLYNKCTFWWNCTLENHPVVVFRDLVRPCEGIYIHSWGILQKIVNEKYYTVH